MLRMWRRSFYRLLPLLLLPACSDDVDPSHPLERDPIGISAPEAQGIESDQLRRLLQAMIAQDLDLHSLLIMRHGQIVLDAVFFPYDGKRPHDLASCTKSLTSTAFGLALTGEQIGSLDQTLLSFFGDTEVRNDSPDKRAVTLAHALTMSTGFDCINEPVEQTLLDMQNAENWVSFALNVPMADAPGTGWRYCSTVTHLLSAVIARQTGEPLDEFLGRTLFDPIGAEAPVWPRDPQGVSHGWGDARAPPTAMARLGQLMLGAGTFAGKELIEPAFVELATTNRVADRGPPNGYGYGWWTTRSTAFYANGRGGQFLIVAPDYDLVVVSTAGASPEQAQLFLQLLSTELEPGLSDAPLAPNPTAAQALVAAVAAVAEPPTPEPVPAPPATAAMLSNLQYTLGPNPIGWNSVSLSFAETEATMSATMASTRSVARIGLDGVPRITRGVRFAELERHANIDVAMKGRWVDATTFEVEFDTLDTIDAGTLRFAFRDDRLDVTLYEKTYLRTAIGFQGTAIPKAP
jgi:CubicO group peptidase (beta-lactamase class C family)